MAFALSLSVYHTAPPPIPQDKKQGKANAGPRLFAGADALSPGQVRLIFAKSCGIYVRTARFGVGVDAYIDPAECTVFYGNPRRIRDCQTGRCGHRPLQTSGKMRYGFALDFRFSQLPAARPLRRCAPAPLERGAPYPSSADNTSSRTSGKMQVSIRVRAAVGSSPDESAASNADWSSSR